MAEQSKEWFSEWFDSRYYHILYKHRDDQEAESFIDKLVGYLNLNSASSILDIPCGKGRHAIYLHKQGLKVIGADLSVESIRYASQFSNERLKFFVHDMREAFAFNEFDVVLNLFTSFGYFETEEENYKTLKVFSSALKNGGHLIIDFMNTSKVVRELVKNESKVVDGIEFQISRRVDKNFVVKDISFTADGSNHHHQEKVRTVYMDDFLKYFNFAELTLVERFGDYKLNSFDEENSDRMIFVLKK